MGTRASTGGCVPAPQADPGDKTRCVLSASSWVSGDNSVMKFQLRGRLSGKVLSSLQTCICQRLLHNKYKSLSGSQRPSLLFLSWACRSASWLIWAGFSRLSCAGLDSTVLVRSQSALCASIFSHVEGPEALWGVSSQGREQGSRRGEQNPTLSVKP